MAVVHGVGYGPAPTETSAVCIDDVRYRIAQVASGDSSIPFFASTFDPSNPFLNTTPWTGAPVADPDNHITTVSLPTTTLYRIYHTFSTFFVYWADDRDTLCNGADYFGFDGGTVTLQLLINGSVVATTTSTVPPSGPTDNFFSYTSSLQQLPAIDYSFNGNAGDVVSFNLINGLDKPLWFETVTFILEEVADTLVTTTANLNSDSTTTDAAVLSGGNSPTGTIHFALYGPDPSDCSGTPVYEDTQTVTGNGTYSSTSSVLSAPGVYRWKVDYSGDSLNAAYSSDCFDNAEKVSFSAITTIECGDVVLATRAGPPDSCLPLEVHGPSPSFALIGEAPVACTGNDEPGLGMAFDSLSNLYIPVVVGSAAGTIQKVDTAGNITTWFTPGSNEFPVNIRFDSSDYAYVVVLAGVAIWNDNGSSMKLYKLDQAGSTISTDTITLPPGSTGRSYAFSGGAAVDPNGRVFYYTIEESGVASVIGRFDLANHVDMTNFARVEFTDPDPAYFTGIILLPDRRVVVGDLWSNTALLRIYSANGTSYTDYDNPGGATGPCCPMDIVYNGRDSWLLCLPNNSAQYVYEFKESLGTAAQIIQMVFGASSGNMPIAVACSTVRRNRIAQVTLVGAS